MLKQCCACKLMLEPLKFNRDRSRSDGLNRKCRACSSAACSRWYEDNKASVAARSAEWREVNSDREKARVAAWRAANALRKRNTEVLYYAAHAEAKRASRRERHKRDSASLADGYVCAVLIEGTSLSRRDIPMALIELKREQLQVHRLLTGLDQAINGEPK